MKDDYTTNSHYLTNTFLFRKVGRMYFLNLGVKGLNLWKSGEGHAFRYRKHKLCISGIQGAQISQKSMPPDTPLASECFHAQDFRKDNYTKRPKLSILYLWETLFLDLQCPQLAPQQTQLWAFSLLLAKHTFSGFQHNPWIRTHDICLCGRVVTVAFL